jgi:hypothetical protein
MSDFDAQQPVRALAVNFTTEVANSAGTTINPAEDFPQGSTTSGQNTLLSGAAVTTAAPTYSTGTTEPLSLDTSGNLRVLTTPSASSLQNVNITEIGGNAVTTTIPVSGTVAVTQSTSPWVSDITQWANVTLGSPSNYGTAPGAVEVIGVNAFITNTVTVAGNLTNNNAAPAATNIGVLAAVAAAASPTWTSGDQVLLSENLSGFLRVVDSSDGSVSAGTAGTTSMLAGGVYNSTPPTLTTGQQVALQVDTNGRLLVDTAASPITPVLTYFTDAAVASGSQTTHTLAGPVTLDKIDFSSSGEMKGTVAIGVTGSEVTYWNGFNSASNQDFSFILNFPYVIPSGSDVKVTLKNRDTAAQDLYVTFFSH